MGVGMRGAGPARELYRLQRGLVAGVRHIQHHRQFIHRGDQIPSVKTQARVAQFTAAVAGQVGKGVAHAEDAVAQPVHDAQTLQISAQHIRGLRDQHHRHLAGLFRLAKISGTGSQHQVRTFFNFFERRFGTLYRHVPRRIRYHAQ